MGKNEGVQVCGKKCKGVEITSCMGKGKGCGENAMARRSNNGHRKPKARRHNGGRVWGKGRAWKGEGDGREGGMGRKKAWEATVGWLWWARVTKKCMGTHEQKQSVMSCPCLPIKVQQFHHPPPGPCPSVLSRPILVRLPTPCRPCLSPCPCLGMPAKKAWHGNKKKNMYLERGTKMQTLPWQNAKIKTNYTCYE